MFKNVNALFELDRGNIMMQKFNEAHEAYQCSLRMAEKVFKQADRNIMVCYYKDYFDYVSQIKYLYQEIEMADTPRKLETIISKLNIASQGLEKILEKADSEKYHS